MEKVHKAKAPAWATPWMVDHDRTRHGAKAGLKVRPEMMRNEMGAAVDWMEGKMKVVVARSMHPKRYTPWRSKSKEWVGKEGV